MDGRYCLISALRALLAVVAILCMELRALALAATLTNGSPAALAAAIEAGGHILLGFDETVRLDRTLLVTNHTTVDASGRNVSLDGGSITRHFIVTNGATLRLINLSLVNGRHFGAAGQTNENGSPGLGGSIYNAGGKLELSGCRFARNQAVGGDAGKGGRTTEGGQGFGGAIYSIDGEIWATNCVFANNVATSLKDSLYTGRLK